MKLFHSKFIIRGSTLVGGALLLCSCQLSAYLWVAPESRKDNLVLGISDTRHGSTKGEVSSIYVYRCADIFDRGAEGYYPPTSQAVWVAQTSHGKQGLVTNRIVYGQSQGTLETTQGPQPLDVPGCYTVMAYAEFHDDLRAATVGFRVEEDGGVRQMSEDDFREVFSRSRRATEQVAGGDGE